MKKKVRIITINSKDKHSRGKKIQISQDLKNELSSLYGKNENLIILLPHGKTIDDLERNKNGTLSTRIREKNGQYSKSASFIKKDDNINRLIQLMKNFLPEILKSINEISGILIDEKDAEIEQCIDYLNKLSNDLDRIKCNPIMLTNYHAELLRKKEFLDLNIKIIRKRIEAAIELDGKKLDVNIDKVTSLKEYMDFHLEIYAKFSIMENILLGRTESSDFDHVLNEIANVYEHNNTRLKPIIEKINNKLNEISNDKTKSMLNVAMLSHFRCRYNPIIGYLLCSYCLDSEKSSAEKIQKNKLSEMRPMDFDKFKEIFISLSSNKFIFKSNNLYELSE